jgi:hypothetical protein
VLDKGVRIDLVGRPVFEWGGDAWVYKYSLSADASRSRYDNPSHPELNTIAQALDKLLFVPLGPGIQDPYRAYDSGVVIPDVSAEWSYNKEIQQQFFEGEELPLDARGYVVTGANLRDDKTYRLSVLSGGLISVFPLVCRFLPRVYYGGHAPTELPWGSILTDLSSTEPTDVVQRVLSVRMKKNECGYLALPYRLCMSSAPRVTVDGVSGGYMELGAFPLKNRFNHTEYFYLYRTIQCGLGEVEVAIR